MYLAGVAKEKKKKGTGLMVTRASCPPKRSLNIDEYYAFAVKIYLLVSNVGRYYVPECGSFYFTN